MLENIAVSFGIPLAYFGMGVAALSALVFPVIQMFQDLKKAKTAFIGIGAIVAVFLICYLLAGNQDLTVGDKHVVGGTMKLIEGSFYTFYVLLATSLLLIAYSSVSHYFNR